MTTAWAVVHYRGAGYDIAANTIRRTRQESIVAAIDWIGMPNPAETRRIWRRLRRAGRVACVRVEVREVGE